MTQDTNMDQPFGTHPLAGKFNDLTPENVLSAVEAGGRRCTGRFIILNSYENRVYQLELDDETMVVGKFYRPGRWSKEAILAEHQFLKELEEVEIPVASPIDLGDGETVGEVTKKLLNEPFLKPSEATPDHDIHAALEAICCKALEKEAKNRFHDVNEMIEELQNYRVA